MFNKDIHLESMWLRQLKTGSNQLNWILNELWFDLLIKQLKLVEIIELFIYFVYL